MRPEGVPAAEAAVTVGERVPEPPAFRVRHRPAARRAQVRGRRGGLRLRVRAGAPAAFMPRTPSSRSGGSLRMPRLSSVSGIPGQAPALQAPFAAFRPGCPRTVFAGPLRLPSGKIPAVSWMPPVHATAREGGRLQAAGPLPAPAFA